MKSKNQQIRYKEMYMWRKENNIKFCSGCGQLLYKSSHHFFCNDCHESGREIKFCVVCGWLVESPEIYYCKKHIPDKLAVTKSRLKHLMFKGKGKGQLLAEKKLLLIGIVEAGERLKIMNCRIEEINKILEG